MKPQRSRRVNIKRIATSTAQTFLDVSVSYDEGGMSYMSGTQRPRGFYVAVNVIRDKGDGFITHVLGQGGSGLLETAQRFNQKRLDQLADAARNPENAALDLIVQMVLARCGLTLPVEAETQPAETWELVTA